MNDVKKLPKWAQDEISRLTKNVEHWKAKALASAMVESGTNTAVYDLVANKLHGLPPGSVVRFNPNGNLSDDMEGEIDIHVFDGAIKVMGRGSQLAVFPDSSNCLSIKPIDR